VTKLGYSVAGGLRDYNGALRPKSISPVIDVKKNVELKIKQES